MLNDFLNNICSQVSLWFPDLAACAPCGGRLDEDALKLLAGATPAVFLAPAATYRAKPAGTGEQDIPLAVTAYVITEDRPGLPRAEAALNLVQEIIVRLENQVWGMDDQVHPPGPAAALNLYSGGIDQAGIAAWEVSWTQEIRMGDDIWKTDLPLPSEIYLGQAPDIGTGHEDDYLLIWKEETP